MNSNPEENTIILNKELNHRIVRSRYGYQLYGFFGYEGEFTSEAEARRAYRDHSKEPTE